MAERTKSREVGRWRRRALAAEGRVAELLASRHAWLRQKLTDIAMAAQAPAK